MHVKRVRAGLLGLIATTVAVLGLTPDPAGASAAQPRGTGVAEGLPGRVDGLAVAKDTLRLGHDGRRWVERALASLTLRQKAAQVVVPWISGASSREDRRELERMLRWVERERVGGLIVSTGRPADLAAKLNAAQARASIPLLVVSDLETGPGMRLRPGGTEMPPAMAFGAAGDAALARAAGYVTGVEARAVGIHATLGPVLDVNTNPHNPIINIRSFGEDPERVAELASAWIEGARAAGLLTIGKHFPGHGDTRVDSHVGLPILAAGAARLDSVELVPFRRAIDAGLDGILVGHIAAPGVTGAGTGPASLSRAVVDGLLRERIGFDGLVVTDALNMGAVTRRYPVAEASVRALLAGADILLQPPDPASVIDVIVDAVESGRLPRARLDEAVRRILVAKARLGLHHDAQVALSRIGSRVNTPDHRAVAQRVARASITLVRDELDLIPLPPETRRVLHVSYHPRGGSSGVEALASELMAAGLDVVRRSVGPRTSAPDYARLRELAEDADVVAISVAVTPRQGRGLEISGRFVAVVEALAAEGLPVVVISTGSPYVLGAFPSLGSYVVGWSEMALSQRAIADVLLGRSEAQGRPPVSTP